MDSTITRAEHEEFRRRIDEENKRQNMRIKLLEENTRKIETLTISIDRLAKSIEIMVKEQDKQGKRIEQLEKEPLEESKANKRAIINCIISGVGGAIISAIFALIINGGV